MRRVISFDGGGIAGALTLQVLKRIQEKCPDFVSKADLFAGTSTGGLIALALANGSSIDDIFKFYLKGKEIFEPNMFGYKGLLKCRYKNDNLKKSIQEIFGDKTLGHLKKNVLIPTFDLDGSTSRNEEEKSWKAKFFTNIDPTDKDCGKKLVDIAMFTSAAPTYFPTVKGFIDGGVIANNPSSAAVHQLISDRPGCKYDPKDIYLVSLGTGSNMNYLNVKNKDWGSVHWIKYIFDILMGGLVDIPDFQCRSILWSRYHRVNPVVKNLPKMDDWKRVNVFIAIANSIDLNPTYEWIKNNW